LVIRTTMKLVVECIKPSCALVKPPIYSYILHKPHS
jgi:hypothetical protein